MKLNNMQAIHINIVINLYNTGYYGFNDVIKMLDYYLKTI